MAGLSNVLFTFATGQRRTSFRVARRVQWRQRFSNNFFGFFGYWETVRWKYIFGWLLSQQTLQSNSGILAGYMWIFLVVSVSYSLFRQQSGLPEACRMLDLGAGLIWTQRWLMDLMVDQNKMMTCIKWYSMLLLIFNHDMEQQNDLISICLSAQRAYWWRPLLCSKIIPQAGMPMRPVET